MRQTDALPRSSAKTTSARQTPQPSPDKQAPHATAKNHANRTCAAPRASANPVPRAHSTRTPTPAPQTPSSHSRSHKHASPPRAPTPAKRPRTATSTPSAPGACAPRARPETPVSAARANPTTRAKQGSATRTGRAITRGSRKRRADTGCAEGGSRSESMGCRGGGRAGRRG